LAGADVEAFDQRFGLGIVLGVEAFMRMTITAKKACEPKYITVICAPHNDRMGANGAVHRQSASDERTLFVSNVFGNDITAIDITSHEVTASIPIGRRRWAFVIDD